MLGAAVWTGARQERAAPRSGGVAAGEHGRAAPSSRVSQQVEESGLSIDAVTPAECVAGVVLDPSGPRSAAVEVSETLSGRVMATTRSDPETGCFRVSLPQGGAHGLRLRAHDPASRMASAYDYLGDTQWFVLRLRDTVEVSGRVVDTQGRPLAAHAVRARVDGLRVVKSWNQAESGREEYDTITGTDGRFALRVRRGGGSARVGARGHGQAWEMPVEFLTTEEDGVDVGDLRVLGRTAIWTVRITDQAGGPCEGALAKLSVEDAWSARQHPGFDAASHWIAVGSDGVLRLELACRDAPVACAIGSARHMLKSFALDCRAPGAREATVRLDPRPRVHVKLVGPHASPLDELGERLVVDATVEGGEVEPAPRDILTQEQAQLPPNRGVAPVSILRMQLGLREARRIGPGTYEFLLPHGGVCSARVELDGWNLCSRRLPVPPAASQVTVIELEIPPGRLVPLDLAALSRWAQDAGPGAWVSPYCAWGTAARARTSPDGTFVDAASRPERPVELLERASGLVTQKSRLWIPLSCDTVAFGFVENPMGLGPPIVAPHTEVTLMGLPGSGSEALCARPPARKPASVVFQVVRSGHPLSARGIPVWVLSERPQVAGSEKAGGDVTTFTDDRGRARVWLLPGLYRARVDGSVSMGDATVVVVGAVCESMEVELELALPG